MQPALGAYNSAVLVVPNVKIGWKPNIPSPFWVYMTCYEKGSPLMQAVTYSFAHISLKINWNEAFKLELKRRKNNCADLSLGRPAVTCSATNRSFGGLSCLHNHGHYQPWLRWQTESLRNVGVLFNWDTVTVGDHFNTYNEIAPYLINVYVLNHFYCSTNALNYTNSEVKIYVA